MSTFKKHVGRIKNTDRRCVVVYMQIPGNDNNALIVDTDALPDRFHDALMTIIDSTEGQQTVHLHTLLARRILPDMGLDMMNALHTYGLLRSVEIDNIVMFPAPNAAVGLREIVNYINGEEPVKAVESNLENRVLENQKSDVAQAQVDIAENILRQAEDLEAEAQRKREKAYGMVPNLRPQVTDSPEVTEASAPATDNTDNDSTQSEKPSEAQQDYLDEHRASAEGMTAGESSKTFLVEAGDNSDELSDEVKAALQEAFAQRTAPPQYNIVESDVEEASTPPYPIVETDTPAQPAVPAYNLVATREDDDEDSEGNQVDTSDEAVQAFLDRAAYRDDRADREAWEASQPKNPVGRPRKDGSPAGAKPEPTPPAPKKRGRPPKAKA